MKDSRDELRCRLLEEWLNYPTMAAQRRQALVDAGVPDSIMRLFDIIGPDGIRLRVIENGTSPHKTIPNALEWAQAASGIPRYVTTEDFKKVFGECTATEDDLYAAINKAEESLSGRPGMADVIDDMIARWLKGIESANTPENNDA